MHFWKLLITALMPVLKVLLVTSVGAFLALDRFNILKGSAKKHLNKIVYFVFMPALVSSILAKTITFKSLIMLWFMPLNVLLAFIIGSALGWLLMKLTRAPHNLKGLVIGCCAGGNLGNLPLIIVPAVCKESSHPFGAMDVCSRNGLAYASLSMAIGNVYIWTYVYNIVRIYSCKSSNVNKVDDSTVNSVSAPETNPENHSKCSTESLVTIEDSSETNDHFSRFEVKRTMPDGQEKEPKKTRIMKQLKSLAEKLNLKALLAPATIGSILGLIIGVIPLFKKGLVGDDAPLHVVLDSASMLGDASIPAMTLLVGANLLKGLKGSDVQLPLIAGIIVVRYIALPILGVGIVKGSVHFRLIHPDPLYQFVLLLQFAVPPAISISTITQLFGAGESEYSIIMLATYACASVSLTLWCTFFMWLVL